MQTHLRAIGVLMAFFVIVAMASCGGSASQGLRSMSDSTPQIGSHQGQFTVNNDQAVARLDSNAANHAREMLSDAPATPQLAAPATKRSVSAVLAGPLAELEALQTPPGADPVLFARLKQSLKRMLMAQGDKIAAKAPISTRSKVDDLQGSGDTTNATFTWTYRSEGDFNQDRFVNIADLAPLGTHFNKTSADATWNAAQLADGNRDNVVNIGDLSSIGINFLVEVSGYHLQYSADGSTGWTQVADVPWTSSAIPGGGGFRVFTHNLGAATEGFYRVLPYDGTGEGIAGDAVQFPGGGTGNPPTAVLAATPTSGDPPLEVDFDASGSSDPDAGDSITKYEFDFGEGGGYEDFGSLNAASHTYNTAGVYTAKLRVWDNNGNSDEDTKTISAGAQADLFTEALTGVGFTPASLTLGDFPDQIAITDFTNYGNDIAGFDDDGDAGTDPIGVPGSRFGAFTNYWHTDHTALPAWSTAYTDAAHDAGDIEDLVFSTTDKFFEGTDTRQAFWADTLPVPGTDYTPAGTNALATAVINLINNNGGTASDASIITDANDVPSELQDALAMVLQAADAAGVAIQADKTNFFGEYDAATAPEENIWHIAYDYSHCFRAPVTTTFLWSFLLFGVTTEDGGTTWLANDRPYSNVLSYPTYAQAMINLSHALDQAQATLSSGTITGSFTFDQETPIGRIVINSGDGDTTYTQGTDPTVPNDFYLLICDVDGNDTYNCCAGANGSMLNPVSINIDLAGNDTYASLDDPTDANGTGDDIHSQQGAGRWGVGALVDYAGNDTYTASVAGQGFSIVGWGLLYDIAGDDIYSGIDYVQGSGMCGVGIAYDGAGADQYNSFAHSQGYGDIWGMGLLLDKGEGADAYFAQWDATVAPAQYASPQNEAINANFCQGAGFGLRTTSTFPIIFDGGIGTLIDGGGNDTYTNGVFGQGLGFWFSTGVLDDRGGDDSYEGDWYVQGATAHLSASIMMDRAGDDKYNSEYATRGFPLENVVLGGAHDFSVSWFLDGGGGDEYFAPSLALGTGNMNGWGYCLDMGAGVDSYTIPNDPNHDLLTLGRGHLSSEAEDGSDLETYVTFGMFIDCGGADTYDAAYATIPSGSIGDVAAGENLGWYRFGYDNDFANDFRSNEFGAGLDGTGTTSFEFD